MITTLNNLDGGLKWWWERHGHKFPDDICNTEYYDIYDARSAGATERWWAATVKRLGQWRAYRGGKPRITKEEITRRGAQRLSEIAAQYTKLISGAEPCIADLSWEDVAPLFELASQIRGGKSPVFSSKMCHFLFPKLFIVMDNTATSVLEYEFYWRGMKDEWHRFKEKDEARNLLANAIKSAKPVHPLYPFVTRIMELSHIGYKHR